MRRPATVREEVSADLQYLSMRAAALERYLELLYSWREAGYPKDMRPQLDRVRSVLSNAELEQAQRTIASWRKP